MASAPNSVKPTNARKSLGSLVVAGTGIQWAGQTTLAAKSAIETADRVLFAVADAGAAAWLSALRPDATSLRYGEHNGPPRREIYRQMVEDILAELDRGLRVCAVFYGHPGVLSTPAHDAIHKARLRGHAARMLPGVSFLDCLFADIGLDPGAEGCLAYDATDFLLRRRPFDVHTPLLLSQIALIGNTHVFDEAARGRVARGLAALSDVLSRAYPASHEVIVYDASTHPIEPPRVARLRLGELTSAPVTDISTLYIPPIAPAPLDEAMWARLSGGSEGAPAPRGEESTSRDMGTR